MTKTLRVGYLLIICCIIAYGVRLVIHSPSNDAEIFADHDEQHTVADMQYTTVDEIGISQYQDHPWDISQNVLDLVTGEITIEIDMPDQSVESLIATANLLSQQILQQNQDKSVTSVLLDITTNNKQYQYDSNQPNRIGEYWKITH